MTGRASAQAEPPELAGAGRAAVRDWAGLAVLALPCLVVSMDATLLHLALPQVAADLRPTGGQLLWIVDAYVFLGAGALLPMGMVGDRVGRRRLLLAGAAAFVAASVLASLATSATLLIAARGLLGLAGATLMPSTLALIRTMFRDAAQRRQAIGVWTASFALGGLLGPVAGGLVLTVGPWPAVFLLAVPPMLLLLALGPVLLPESRDPGASRVDLLSAGTSLAAVLAIVVGLTGAAAAPDPEPVLAVVLGLGLAVLLVRRQRRHANPALDPALFGRASFTVPLAVNALAFFVLYGTQYLTAQYLQLVLGLSPLAAGLWGVPGTLGYVLGSAVGPLVTRRAGPEAVVAAGLLVSAAGFGLLTQVGVEAGLGVVVAGTVIFGFGIAPVYALTTELVVAAAPGHRAGTAAATQETGAELGGALGIALLGSLSLVVYRAGLPAGTPGEARETLAAAGQQPEGVADAARAAFTSSYVVAETVGALLLVAAAGAVTALLRRPGRAGSGPVDPGPAPRAPGRRPPAAPAAAAHAAARDRVRAGGPARRPPAR